METCMGNSFSSIKVWMDAKKKKGCGILMTIEAVVRAARYGQNIISRYSWYRYRYDTTIVIGYVNSRNREN